MMDLIQAAQVRAYPARHGVCGVREPLGLWMRWHHETQQSLSRALNRQGCTQERTVDVGAGRQRAAGRLRVSLVVFDTCPVLNLGWGGWPQHLPSARLSPAQPRLVRQGPARHLLPAGGCPTFGRHSGPLYAVPVRPIVSQRGTTAGNGHEHGWRIRTISRRKEWCPQRNSNPCRRLERPVS